MLTEGKVRANIKNIGECNARPISPSPLKRFNTKMNNKQTITVELDEIVYDVTFEVEITHEFDPTFIELKEYCLDSVVDMNDEQVDDVDLEDKLFNLAIEVYNND